MERSERQPYAVQAARRRIELILVISPESYAIPCTDLLSLPLPPIALQLSRGTAHPERQDGAAPCVTSPAFYCPLYLDTLLCCPSFERSCTRYDTNLSPLAESVQRQIWRIFLEVTVLSVEHKSMRVSLRYLRKILLTFVLTFSLCRWHPVVMYERSKGRQPQRNYLLLPLICFGFRKKYHQEAKNLYNCLIMALKMSKHETNNKNWQRNGLRSVLPLCT